MIISAAVKILLKKENREVTIPCHRHGDAYKILKDLGFHPSIKFLFVYENIY